MIEHYQNIIKNGKLAYFITVDDVAVCEVETIDEGRQHIRSMTALEGFNGSLSLTSAMPEAAEKRRKEITDGKS